jgi:DNA-binding FadR family transcriptional regulator
MTTPKGTRLVIRPGADSKAKRAAKVADRIVEDVMSLGWPVGEVLGSEADLLDRYRVSRAVFREAVRLVEHQQVARTRRGPGGGLVITEPTAGAVTDAVVLYLQRVDARLDEIYEARIVLEGMACDLASQRTGARHRADLRRLAEGGSAEPGGGSRDLHALVAATSCNVGLELLVDVMGQVAALYAPDGQRFGDTMVRKSRHAHAMIAQAVIAGDGELARTRMRTHLQAEADVFRRRRSTRQLLPESVVLTQSGAGKGAETVARNISRIIVADGLQPGDLVGTEPELIERAGVSRALLREAVRLLEHHHIAQMRRGPGGGLFVMSPNTGAVTEAAAIYLARRGMKLAELADLRLGVEVALTDLAAARIDDEGTAGLNEAIAEELDAEGDRTGTVHDLHAAIAAAAHNRVLQLVALVLIRLSRLPPVERLAPKGRKQMSAEMLRTHQDIARAIEGGDRELARNRMRRHLDALGALMQ